MSVYLRGLAPPTAAAAPANKRNTKREKEKKFLMKKITRRHLYLNIIIYNFGNFKLNLTFYVFWCILMFFVIATSNLWHRRGMLSPFFPDPTGRDDDDDDDGGRSQRR